MQRRGRIQTPGRRAVVGAISRDSDESSPEPSPIAHPEPLPWTPAAGLENVDDEETSLPSMPNVPSPHPSPSPSLFSGEEFPPKSVRKPVAEVAQKATPHQHLYTASPFFSSASRSFLRASPPRGR